MNEQALTDGELRDLTFALHQGKAHPDDAQRLILELHRLTSSSQQLPEILRWFLSEAFSKILSGTSADKAFGLQRAGAGRPSSQETHEKNVKTATEVLRRRLEGMTLEEAAADVEVLYSRSPTQVRDAYSANKHEALFLLRIERALDEYPWNSDEIVRLCKIFKNDPLFVPPGNSKKNPA